MTLSALSHARAQHAAVWRWLRLAAPIMLGLQLAALVAARPGPGLRGGSLWISAAIGGFALGGFGALALRRRPGRIRTACVCLLFIAGLVLARLQPHGAGILGLFFGIVFLTRRLPSRWGGVVGITAAAATEAGIHHSGHFTAADLVTGIAMLSLYVLTDLARQLSETNARAADLLEQLDRNRGAQARAAALSERQRMAREMHDILAHSLSGLLLQLEAARILVRHRPDDQRVPVAIQRAHDLAKVGLDEAREAIGTLREETLPGPDELPQLTAQFQQDTGVRCDLRISGPSRPLDPQVQLAVFRVAQEALTNAMRHARPTAVTVDLAYGTQEIRLVVENDAAGPRSGRCGYGLAGMRERAELLGGRLDAIRERDRFRVELAVPAV